MKKILVLLSIFLLFLGSLVAQPPSPPAGATTSPGCWPPPCVPIDGGISFLIAAGIGLGVKKAYDSRKKMNPKAE
jgi:hypothetical protein